MMIELVYDALLSLFWTFLMLQPALCNSSRILKKLLLKSFTHNTFHFFGLLIELIGHWKLEHSEQFQNGVRNFLQRF